MASACWRDLRQNKFGRFQLKTIAFASKNLSTCIENFTTYIQRNLDIGRSTECSECSECCRCRSMDYRRISIQSQLSSQNGRNSTILDQLQRDRSQFRHAASTWFGVGVWCCCWTDSKRFIAPLCDRGHCNPVDC